MSVIERHDTNGNNIWPAMITRVLGQGPDGWRVAVACFIAGLAVPRHYDNVTLFDTKALAQEYRAHCQMDDFCSTPIVAYWPHQPIVLDQADG